MNYRKITIDDYPLIEAAASKYLASSTHAEGPFKIDRDYAFDVLQATIENGDAYYVSGFLVLVAEKTAWFSPLPVLCEVVTLRLIEEGDIDDVPKAVAQIAKDRLYSHAIISDGSRKQLLAQACIANGFVEVTRSFTKGV